jgi:hypothetical protein
MTTTLVIVFGTALMSSVFTLALGYILLNRYLRARVEVALREVIRRINAEVGPEIESRVKTGVRDGIRSISSREVLRETTRTMARTGAELVNEGIKPFLKKRRPRSESDMLNGDDDDFY